MHQNGLSLGHALLGLSPNAPPGPKEGDLATQDAGHDSRRTHAEKGEADMSIIYYFMYISNISLI